MKILKISRLLVLGLGLSLFASCLVVKQDLAPTANPITGELKKATAGATYVLGFIPIGAVDFHEAVKNAGIKKVISVENKTTYILGSIAWKYEQIIYGE
ncbi:MAG: hypothetical protein OXB93_01420 [Cytophagales bacterium]|nr:hypothetical protein [Cytophagales bacterium]